MTEAQQLIAEIQERLNRLNELLSDGEQQPHKLHPGDQAPAIEWLKQLEEPWRSEAFRMVEVASNFPSIIVASMSDALNYAFRWGNDWQKWDDYCKSLKAQGK